MGFTILERSMFTEMEMFREVLLNHILLDYEIIIPTELNAQNHFKSSLGSKCLIRRECTQWGQYCALQ